MEASKQQQLSRKDIKEVSEKAAPKSREDTMEKAGKCTDKKCLEIEENAKGLHGQRNCCIRRDDVEADAGCNRRGN